MRDRLNKLLNAPMHNGQPYNPRFSYPQSSPDTRTREEKLKDALEGITYHEAQIKKCYSGEMAREYEAEVQERLESGVYYKSIFGNIRYVGTPGWGSEPVASTEKYVQLAIKRSENEIIWLKKAIVKLS